MTMVTMRAAFFFSATVWLLWLPKGVQGRPLDRHVETGRRKVHRKPPNFYILRGGATSVNSRDGDEQDAPLLDTETPPQQQQQRHRTFISSAVNNIRSQGDKFESTLKKHVEAMHPKLHLNAKKSVEHLKTQSSKMFQSAGPSFLSLWTPSPKGTLRFSQIYALSLVGSACGFYLFLYFITVGYALGVSLPVAVSLILCNIKNSNIPFWTNVQASLIVLWGIRSAAYFLHREYVNWPQLHEKVVQVDEMARLSSKIFCWLAYPLFYVMMMTPCLSRLQQATTITTSTTNTWSWFGKMGIMIQLLGLTMETIADYQKSVFKSQPGNRHEWCHVGLWTFSTHPNYLGELLFWLGNLWSGMGAFSTTKAWIASIVGFLFITVVLSGARSSLGSKHWRKYGTNTEFVEFRRTHSILGPIPGKKPQDDRVSLL